MKPVDVVILYEHVDRELDVACAVKCLAGIRHGLRVEIIQHPHGSLQSDLPIGDLRPRVVILPHAYLSSIYTPYLLDWPKAIYINAMWEQIFYPGNAVAKLPVGAFSLKHVIHHAWAKFSADYLQRAGVSADNIVINGHPAYALYSSPYCRYYQTRAELARKYRLDEQARWVFFPENYNWAFYSENTLRAFINNGQEPEDVYAMRDFCRQSFNEVVQWCSSLAQSNGLEVIIRPRPSTPVQEFETVVRRILSGIPPQLRIIKGESVREWVMASDSVVSSYSTSLIEAAIAGKSVHMLEPVPLPSPLRMNWHDLAPRYHTYSEFAAGETEATTGPDRRLERWARSEMMSTGDAIGALVTLLADLVSGRRAAPRPLPETDIPRPIGGAPMRGGWLELQYHRARRKYQHWRVKMTKRMGYRDSFYEKDVVPQAEIYRRVEKWRQVLDQV